MKTYRVSIIGGGPSGLMAAETLARAGATVTVYERKASVGRKFLMAGRGGLNLTHSEEMEKFRRRYGDAAAFISPLIEDFSPDRMRNWCASLGETTFVGSSGRIFPGSFKASPLLRAWIKRLEGLGVHFRLQKTWLGWNDNAELVFHSPRNSCQTDRPDFTVLALGGASWPSLGSDGSWADILTGKNIDLAEFEPANCGFNVEWSDVFRDRFQGQPLKSIQIVFNRKTVPGEIMISQNGIEGGAVYALSSKLRKSLKNGLETILDVDLRPTLSKEQITERLRSNPQKRQSFSSYMERVMGLSALETGLLREADMKVGDYEPLRLAQLIKSVPLVLRSPFPMEKAISTAGGIKLDEVDGNMMLRKIPGTFIAGEMLDWEAPTGGYLLQGCFATGHAAGKGIINYASNL